MNNNYLVTLKTIKALDYAILCVKEFIQSIEKNNDYYWTLSNNYAQLSNFYFIKSLISKDNTTISLTPQLQYLLIATENKYSLNNKGEK